MKTFPLMMTGLGIAMATVPSVASAQNYGNWQTIGARQAPFERRIDMGLRNGSLSRNEAVRLRADFRQIAQLEQRYRRDGLSLNERRDLDRRFAQLSARVKTDRHVQQGRRR